ncbi:MAG: hypothetical protein WCW65_01015 [Candidatus Paceibacterota bacterium]
MEEKVKFHKFLGAIFILVGLTFYPTPIPGTTILIIMGLILVFGKRKTLVLLKEHLNKKVFKYLRINKIFKKL